MTVQECIDAVQQTAKASKRFKIGKTGLTSTERRNQEDYVNTYLRITAICQSPSSKTIDDYEIAIIKHFKGYPNNDNEQDGGGEMAESKMYIVYMAWS